MLIEFEGVRDKLLNRYIPDLLSKKIEAPLKGQVLFLKALTQHLSRVVEVTSLQKKATSSPYTQSTLSSGFVEGIINLEAADKSQDNAPVQDGEQLQGLALAGALRLFSLQHPEMGQYWYMSLYESKRKVDCFLEEQMFDSLIRVLVNCIQKGQYNILRNSDPSFNGQDILWRALKHRSESLRLQLLSCYADSASSQQKIADLEENPHGVSFVKISLPLCREFSPFPKPENTSKLTSVYEEIQQYTSYAPQARFLRSAFRQLEKDKTAFKFDMTCGLLRLVQSVLDQTSQRTPFHIWIDKQVQDLQIQPTSPLKEGRMSHATLVFLQANIFKQGCPNRGLALIPLFGIEEMDAWQYWQKALNWTETSTRAFMQAKLQNQKQVTTGSLFGLFSPQPEKPTTRLEKPLLSMR